jgi:hypothetical protein
VAGDKYSVLTAAMAFKALLTLATRESGKEQRRAPGPVRGPKLADKDLA